MEPLPDYVFSEFNDTVGAAFTKEGRCRRWPGHLAGSRRQVREGPGLHRPLAVDLGGIHPHAPRLRHRWRVRGHAGDGDGAAAALPRRGRDGGGPAADARATCFVARSSCSSRRRSSPLSPTRPTPACSGPGCRRHGLRRAANYREVLHDQHFGTRAAHGPIPVTQVPIMLVLAVAFALAIDSAGSGAALRTAVDLSAVRRAQRRRGPDVGYLYGPSFGPITQLPTTSG